MADANELVAQRSQSPAHDNCGDVMVVGGGISGIQAALDLATAGFRVYLVEKTPTIGGKMAQLDKTFPTNDCSMCIESPKFIECDRQPNIEILTYTEVASVEGKAGDFKVTLTKKPRYIIEDKCTGCTTCFEYCPVKIPDPFNQNLSLNKAVHIYFAQAVPLVSYIDDSCLYLKDKTCAICQAVCENDAIDFNQTAEKIEVKVGAIVLSPGYETFDPRVRGDYGYGTLQNVVTSLDFERLLCATGPYEGQIRRPSDKKHPHKVAWIHCVGSRQVIPGGNTLLLRGLLLVHAETGDPGQRSRPRHAGDDLPQRYSVVRQGLRALLPARGETARGGIHQKLRLDRQGNSGNQERHDQIFHDKRRSEGGGIRSGGAVGRTEPARRCEGVCKKIRRRARAAGVLQDQPGEPDRDDPPGNLHQRRLPGSAGHS